MTVADLHKNLKREGIGLCGYVILQNIEVSPEIIADLAKLAQVEWATCAKHVAMLCDRGLVSRVKGAGDDSRRVSVYITRAGLDMLGRMEK